jgi:putative ABC transport system permease protein
MSGTQQNLTLEDAAAILQEVPGIQEIAPVVNGNAQVKYLNKNSRTSVTGTTRSYFTARNFEVEKGRAFTEVEAEQLAHVAVIGPTTAENLFGTREAEGEVFKLNGINFRVIGILKSKGDQGWFNPDDQVLVPYTTAMKQLFGLTYVREIDILAENADELTKLQEQTTAVLRKRHHLQSDAPDDFNVRNQAEVVETLSSMTRTMTILLGGIAGISLLVGGIGIMNIMLVSVTERTREIGVRKAIGAKERDILRQFLIEALLMTGTGGLFGVALGIGVAEIVSRTFEFATLVQPLAVLIALGFSAGVGVFFGYYPAHRAAMLDPIEALRYE